MPSVSSASDSYFACEGCIFSEGNPAASNIKPVFQMMRESGLNPKTYPRSPRLLVVSNQDLYELILHISLGLALNKVLNRLSEATLRRLHILLEVIGPSSVPRAGSKKGEQNIPLAPLWNVVGGQKLQPVTSAS